MTAYAQAQWFGDLKSFSRARASGTVSPFTPTIVEHVYIKLDFKSLFENARTAEDARGFLRSVARAALAAHRVAEIHDGVLMEVQGSMLHVGLPTHSTVGTNASQFAAALHWALRQVFGDPGSRVDGWRMTGDAGETLVVAGRGVHGDDSWVSLGSAANRPAKYLYAQLELPEPRRQLKRFHWAFRLSGSGGWRVVDLDQFPSVHLDRLYAIAREASSSEPSVRFVDSLPRATGSSARAVPFGSPGQGASPSAERPRVFFGWVMRADLDGFTRRVEVGFGNVQKLTELAAGFYGIMDAAARFTSLHDEMLVQLPWAGDNFTATAVFSSKEQYNQAVPKRLVELSLDFDKDMAPLATQSGFGGWAHGVAGGEVHGNSGGNVYLAAVELETRRFLIGAGEGFGRSTQAFGDVNPAAKDLVLYRADWERLDASYKGAFEPAVTYRGEQSALYRTAKTPSLVLVRARDAVTPSQVRVTLPGCVSQAVSGRPYSP